MDTSNSDTENKKFNWQTLVIMIFTAIAVGAACFFAPKLYENVIKGSNISVAADLKGVLISPDHPEWFKYNDTAIMSCRALDRSDIVELNALVSDTCQKRNTYVISVGELAYNSNNHTSNIIDLCWLTLCLVFLGCSARTFYDFIGIKCYTKKGQNMTKWWPWYIFRPIICAPIAALLIVSVRTSYFSNLFVSKDLNTYLVISFIAGFAIMEFLTMLRRLSKSLFGADDNNEEEENEDEKNKKLESVK